MENLIVLNPNKCTGCSTCEIVCSLKNEGECNPTRSRISVIKQEMQAIHIPIVCLQCEKPMCKDVCPVNAIYEDPKLGILIDEEGCIGCRLCTMACPLGAIAVDYIRRAAVKCDLCGGDPMCAKFCPFEAINYVRRDKISLIQRREGMQKLIESTSLMLTERGKRSLKGEW